MAQVSFPASGLTDGIVGLREMDEADVPAVTAACQDPEIQRWTMVPSPYSERDARDWMRASRAEFDAGTGLHTLIVASSPAGVEEVVGAVGVNAIDPFTRRCQGGYWIAAPARGSGYAARALVLLAEFAFRALGVARIELWIEPANAGSQRVAERAGFTREGLMRSFMPVSGLRRDMLMYALIPPPDRPPLGSGT
ncbi:GNAT family N-acetyltransferase [Thermoleophilia bacterium SCSIO 60948]|nr:GNAT family N-acetyltransferase [Thermoleophilia bacterium SCSIO 60948]